MKKIINRVKQTILSARLHDPIVLYIFLLLALPHGVFEISSLYTFRTPSYISYGYELLHEPVSVLYAPIFLYMFYQLASRADKYLLAALQFIILIFAVQAFRGFFFDSFLFERNQYELFFSAIVSVSIAGVLFSRLRSYENQLSFFELFIFAHMAGMLLAVLLQVKDSEGRVNAQNLDFGITGLIFGVYCVYLWLVRRRVSIVTMTVPLVPLIYTGTRGHLYITLAFLGYSMISSLNIRNFLKGRQSPKGLLVMVFTVVLLFAALFLLKTENVSSLKSEALQRALSVQSIDDLAADESTLGRLMSLLAGLKVLAEHPFGVSFSFIDLQFNMNLQNYPTFPHQTFLATYLVLGPIFFIILFYFFRTLMRLMRAHHPYRYVYYYILIYSLVAGGPPYKLKVLFIYLFLLWIGAKSVQTGSITKYPILIDMTARRSHPSEGV